jgi:hypothetical protein
MRLGDPQDARERWPSADAVAVVGGPRTAPDGGRPRLTFDVDHTGEEIVLSAGTLNLAVEGYLTEQQATELRDDLDDALGGA